MKLYSTHDWLTSVVMCVSVCRYDEAYSWQYVNCCVHNIIVGTIWIEHVSESLSSSQLHTVYLVSKSVSDLYSAKVLKESRRVQCVQCVIIYQPMLVIDCR